MHIGEKPVDFDEAGVIAELERFREERLVAAIADKHQPEVVAPREPDSDVWRRGISPRVVDREHRERVLAAKVATQPTEAKIADEDDDERAWRRTKSRDALQPGNRPHGGGGGGIRKGRTRVYHKLSPVPCPHCWSRDDDGNVVEGHRNTVDAHVCQRCGHDLEARPTTLDARIREIVSASDFQYIERSRDSGVSLNDILDLLMFGIRYAPALDELAKIWTVHGDDVRLHFNAEAGKMGCPPLLGERGGKRYEERASSRVVDRLTELASKPAEVSPRTEWSTIVARCEIAKESAKVRKAYILRSLLALYRDYARVYGHGLTDGTTPEEFAAIRRYVSLPLCV